MLDYRVLKVVSVEENEKENRTITLSPQELRLFVVYNQDTVVIRGDEYKKCSIVFIDGESYDVTLGEIDIDRLETLIGGYGIPLD